MLNQAVSACRLAAKAENSAKRNPGWVHEQGGFEEIHISRSKTRQQQNAVLKPVIWIILGFGFSAAAQENPPPNSVVLEKPSLAHVWLGINQDVAPFDNVNVRRAVQHAVDRQSVVDAAYFGAASVGNGIIAPGMPGSRSGVTYDYDPDKARDMLKKEGISSLYRDAGYP